MSAFFAILLTLLAVFLILLVLVQRGRGGGLAGALGGMGGSSAFGAKAGDVFTRITIITAAIWIVISIIAFFWAAHRGDALGRASDAGPLGGGSPSSSEPLDVIKQPKADDTPATTVAPSAEKSEAAPAAAAPPAESPAAPVATETAPPASAEATPPATNEPAPPVENK